MDDTYSIIPEFGPIPSNDKSGASAPEYIATEEERKEIKRIEQFFSKANRYKAQYNYKWLDWYKMFRGKQWKEARPSYRHSEVINLVFQMIQSQVPIITDPRPKFEFLPQEPTDFALSEILNAVAQADWIKYNWQYQLTELIYDGYFYGTGLSCMKFCPEKQRVEFESTDPFYFFPAPSAKDVNECAPYVIYAEPMDISAIRDKWPDRGQYVKPDLVDLMRGSKTDLGPVRFKSPTDQRMSVDGSAPADYSEKDKALVTTCYYKCEDYEEFDDFQYDPTSGAQMNVKSEKLKYPNGKKTVISNGVLLEMGPNPYEDGLWPYARWQNYILPREFWGVSEIEQLEGPQKTFNKLISFALDVLTLMGNPIWIVDNTAGVDTDNLFNRPGLVVEKEPGSQVVRQEGVQLQPYVLQLIDRLKEWFDQIGGSNDVTRGLNPSGVTAASAIADLQNAAQTRIRQKSRNLDIFLQQVGQQYLSRIFQFYTAPQVFRITGQDGANKYFKMHVAQDEMGTRKVAVENFGPDGLSLGINEFQARGEFDVRVTTGSSLPFSKSEKQTQLYGLFDRGIIDGEEVMKGLDYPNWEAVLQRQQQKMAQEQAMQAQGGGAPGAAPPQGGPPPPGPAAA